MPDKDSRYNMDLSLQYTITKADGSEYCKVGPVPLSYKNMDYAQITITQGLVADFAKSLTDTGLAAAAAIGFGPELEKLKGLKK